MKFVHAKLIRECQDTTMVPFKDRANQHDELIAVGTDTRLYLDEVKDDSQPSIRDKSSGSFLFSFLHFIKLQIFFIFYISHRTNCAYSTFSLIFFVQVCETVLCSCGGQGHPRIPIQ